MKYRIAFVLASALFICMAATTQDQEKSKPPATPKITPNETVVSDSDASSTTKPQELDIRARIERSVFSHASKPSFDLGSLGCPPNMECKDRLSKGPASKL